MSYKSLGNLGIGAGTTSETFGVQCVKSGVYRNLAGCEVGLDRGGDDVYGLCQGRATDTRSILKSSLVLPQRSNHMRR